MFLPKKKKKKMNNWIRNVCWAMKNTHSCTKIYQIFEWWVLLSFKISNFKPPFFPTFSTVGNSPLLLLLPQSCFILPGFSALRSLTCYLQTLYKLCTNEIMLLQVDENLCSRLPSSTLKSLYLKKLSYISLMQNIPNYLVRCIIQKILL